MSLIQVLKIDTDGNYIEPILVEEQYDANKNLILPTDCVLPFSPDVVWNIPKYDRTTSTWVESKPIDALVERKSEKMQELSILCTSAIYGRFQSTFNGATYSFSCDAEAQSNFEKVDRAFEKGRITTKAWTAYDSNGNIVRLDYDINTFETLYVDHLNHIDTNVSRLRDTLMTEVSNATTIDEVNNINW